MAREIACTFISHCPYTDELQDIRLTYAEISVAGQQTPGYKLINYSHPCGGKCPYSSKPENYHCRIVELAPRDPY